MMCYSILQVNKSHIDVLGRCAVLEELSISHYVPNPGPFSLEEFACLTGLRNLDLKFTAHGNKCAPLLQSHQSGTGPHAHSALQSRLLSASAAVQTH